MVTSLKFKLDNVDEFQLEITNFCNAACPQCPRNLNGGKENPHIVKEHLSRECIDTAFTKEICANLRQIFFCGGYGDPIVHPEFLDILRDFRAKNPTLWILIHTNGGARKTEWWAELAEIIGEHGKVEFNIDGLKDTNHLYRCNTDFDKIITNAEAFIRAGGKAAWNFIVFKHNEHQVAEASMLAALIGFESFNQRSTGRFLEYNNFSELKQWPKEDKAGNVEYNIEYPAELDHRNKSMVHLPKLKDKYNDDLHKYFSSTPITCDALCTHHGNGENQKSKLLVTANGLVMPCNFFNHNLYDARFHDRDILPGASDMAFLPNGENQIRDLFNRHDAFNTLSIQHNTLADIMKQPFWTEVTDSFNKPLGEGRLFECALTCGKEFYKVWDQLEPQGNKYLITGGNRGLGLELINHFRGVNVSRSEDSDMQADITNPYDIDRIVQESLNYDVFINNAFDGPAGEAHSNFAQVNLLIAVYDAWKAANKQGHIINIGSTGLKDIVAPDPSFERYRVSKAALEHASKQCTRAFKDNLVPFKTSLINFDRLDTPLSRSRDSWTGNGTPCADVIKTIEFILDSHPNTCIEEVTSWLNKDYTEK